MSDETPRLQDYQALAKQLLDGGEPDAARVILEKALPVAEAQKDHPVVVSMLGMLAACHTRLMRFSEAEAAYERAMRIADERLQAAHPVRAIVICSRAAFERSRGALEDEKRLWQLVLPVLQQEPRLAPLLQECQRALQEIETVPPREQQLRESLDAARVADMSMDGSFDERAASFQAAQQPATELAALLKGMGRHRESQAAVRDGLMMRPDELWRRLTAVTAPYRQRVLDEQRCRFNLFLLEVLRDSRPEAFQTTLETMVWRRGIGLEIHRSANRVARHDAEARRLLDTLRLSRARYAASLFAAPADDTLPSGVAHTEMVLEPIDLSVEYQEMEAQLFSRLGPEVNRFVSRPADCAELAATLPDGGLLVEYWRCTWPGDPAPVSAYVAMVLPHGRPDKAAVVHLCDSATLEALLLDYLSLLTGRSKMADFGHLDEVAPDPARARELGERIRELVLDPLTTWVTGARHLLIVTDGLLSRLPFAALPVGDGYLMDRWLVSYLHSARDLFGRDEASTASGAPMVISDPAYDWPGSVAQGAFRFTPLPFATQEAAVVARMLGVTPVAGIEATKQALTTCRAPEILHIATHGMMLPASPSVAEVGPVSPLIWRDAGEARLHLPGVAVLVAGMDRLSGRQLPDQALRSIVALAGVNTWLAGDSLPAEAGNGLLTADDVAAMDLVGNRLTVLSACETGLGVIGIGEGVLGLASSFAVAGAETVVTSLWNADDVATMDVMAAFYAGVRDGKGRAEALQEAQARVRDQYPDDPFYWGAFVCHGAFEPITPGPAVLRS